MVIEYICEISFLQPQATSPPPRRLFISLVHRHPLTDCPQGAFHIKDTSKINTTFVPLEKSPPLHLFFGTRKLLENEKAAAAVRLLHPSRQTLTHEGFDLSGESPWQQSRIPPPPPPALRDS